MVEEIGISKGYLIGINAKTLYSENISPFYSVSLRRRSKACNISVTT